MPHREGQIGSFPAGGQHANGPSTTPRRAPPTPPLRPGPARRVGRMLDVGVGQERPLRCAAPDESRSTPWCNAHSLPIPPSGRARHPSRHTAASRRPRAPAPAPPPPRRSVVLPSSTTTAGVLARVVLGPSRGPSWASISASFQVRDQPRPRPATTAWRGCSPPGSGCRAPEAAVGNQQRLHPRRRARPQLLTAPRRSDTGGEVDAGAPTRP